MTQGLEISFAQGMTVVLSTIGMYASFLLMIRIFGSRVLARMSSFDLVVTLMMGAIAGRAVLGHTPVLAAGVLGLGTLLVLEVVVGVFRSSHRGNWLLAPPPVMIIEDGAVLKEGLRRAHVTHAEVAGALRQAGVRHVAEVEYGIFESTGAISVLRRGRDVDPELLVDVIRPRSKAQTNLKPPPPGDNDVTDPQTEGP